MSRKMSRNVEKRGVHAARLPLEPPREGISWYKAKAVIVREAVRAYRSKPLHGLNATA